MNHWHDELMIGFRRQELLREAEQVRLERLALQSRVYRPGLFERTMFNFANWMISTGKQLRKRYEVPAVHCSHSSPSSFASH